MSFSSRHSSHIDIFSTFRSISLGLQKEILKESFWSPFFPQQIFRIDVRIWSHGHANTSTQQRIPKLEVKKVSLSIWSRDGRRLPLSCQGSNDLFVRAVCVRSSSPGISPPVFQDPQGYAGVCVCVWGEVGGGFLGTREQQTGDTTWTEMSSNLGLLGCWKDQ